MGPTLPAVGYKKQKFANKMGQALKAGSEAYNEYQENEALKAKGIDLQGIKDPQTRAQIIAHELKQGQATKRANATRDLGVDSLTDEPVSTKRDTKEKQKNKKIEPPEVDEIIPSQKEKKQKKYQNEEQDQPMGLYPQRQFQGPLQQVLNPQQVEQQGRQFAAEANRREPGANITDEEGIQIANDRNNQRMAHNENIKNEEKEQQQMKSALNAKGQEMASSFSQDPEVVAQFGKETEELGKVVDSEADLDKQLAEKANKFKNTLHAVKSQIPAYRGKASEEGSVLTDKDINDIRIKIKPLLEQGFYGQAREVLQEKGYGLEERETIISSLSEPATKAISQTPSFKENYKQLKLGDWRGYKNRAQMKVQREYTPEEQESINTSIQSIFDKDPNTNIVLLRKELREKKNIDWTAYKDALDSAVTTGKLEMTPEQRQHFDYMNEPEMGPLDQIMYYFTGKGK